MPSSKQTQESAMTLMEEATHLLRRAPLAAWLSYCVGTLPFTCYLIFFFNDMGRSAQAPAHLTESALILAVLYAWMKTWHAVFCDQLLGILEARDISEPLGFRAWARLAACQAWIHATMPLVFLITALRSFPLAGRMPFTTASAPSRWRTSAMAGPPAAS
jgi:hypothetical protein